MTADEVFAEVKKVLVNDFDIEADEVTPEALINDDLDLDSIDAVEMIVKLKPIINGKISPEDFKTVKTVQDVVNVVLPLAK